MTKKILTLNIRHLLLITLSFITSGCALFSTATPETPLPEKEEVFAEYPEPDWLILAVLDTYRDSLDQIMNKKIATVTDTVRFGQPESALGNMAADALRFRAARELRSYVHTAVIGQDSFRLFFLPGDLTLGEVYEFMPYENHLVVLTLTGEMLEELSHQIAGMGGGPVSGIRFRIHDGSAMGILINAEVLDPRREYLVATSSYLANGGGNFSALWNPVNRLDLTDVSIRELYVNYFRNQVTLTPVTDGRIRK